jgi:GntR family transcriptional regulator, transcriptional repressor for pyruvate dehydrogenase complex
MFKTIKKTTVTEQIMEQLAELITSGKIQPGEKLPNERDLADMLGVTRGRIREALRALSLIGLISIKAGEGSYVNEREAPFPPDTIVWMFHNERNNLDEVYAARKLIETEIYLEAFKNMNDEQKRKLKDIMGKISFFHPDKEIPSQVDSIQDLVDEMDLFIAEYCGNRIYTKLMQTVVYLRRETSLHLLNVPGAIENSILTRSRLVEAILNNDLQQLQKALKQFFIEAKKFYGNIITE